MTRKFISYIFIILILELNKTTYKDAKKWKIKVLFLKKFFKSETFISFDSCNNNLLHESNYVHNIWNV